MIMLEFMAINVMRERESALNGIRKEFMALAKERELALKIIRMDFCGSKCC